MEVWSYCASLKFCDTIITVRCFIFTSNFPVLMMTIVFEMSNIQGLLGEHYWMPQNAVFLQQIFLRRNTLDGKFSKNITTVKYKHYTVSNLKQGLLQHVFFMSLCPYYDYLLISTYWNSISMHFVFVIISTVWK